MLILQSPTIRAISYESWLDHSKQMSKLADHELEDAYAMRESLFCSREKARNLLNAQQERTEHTIRKRIFDTQRSRNELEWQMLKVIISVISKLNYESHKLLN